MTEYTRKQLLAYSDAVIGGFGVSAGCASLVLALSFVGSGGVPAEVVWVDKLANACTWTAGGVGVLGCCVGIIASFLLARAAAAAARE